MAHYVSGPRRFEHNRPQPLALNQHNTTYVYQHPQHAHHTHQQPLRSAPLPHHPQPSYGTSTRAPNPPLTAAWNQFQSDQLAYLQEMERSLQLQQELQRQIVMQQQVEAENNYRRMLALQQQQGQGQQTQVKGYGGGVYAQQQQAQRGYHAAPHQQQPQPQNVQFYPPVEQVQPAPAQAQHDSNPLVASALARRAKRQSYNGAPVEQQHPANYPSPAHQAYRTPSGHGIPRERRSPSPYGRHSHSHSPSPSQRGPRRPSPPPPAVILSAPGEPYPDTSSSGSASSWAMSEDGGSESGETRPSSPEREKDQPQLDVGALKNQRRRSHLDSLANLGSHASNRRGGQNGNQQQQQRSLGVTGGQSKPHQRAVSSPASSSAQASPSSPSAPSPLFATARAMPAPVPGTSSAVRQPRGPPTELGDANFSARIRQKAVGELRGLARRRASGNALVVGGAVDALVEGMRSVAVC